MEPLNKPLGFKVFNDVLDVVDEFAPDAKDDPACACYEWLFDDLRSAVDHSSLGHEPWIDNEDGAVFVDVVEFTQNPERIALWGRAISLVWLRVQDRCELVWLKKSLQARRSIDWQFVGVDSGRCHTRLMMCG